jgi:hypothetical protein
MKTRRRFAAEFKAKHLRPQGPATRSFAQIETPNRLYENAIVSE